MTDLRVDEAHKMQPCSGKRQEEMTAEWDRLAPVRERQLAEGSDLSLEFILLPAILSLASASDLDAVVDVGCGVGLVSEVFGRRARRVVGVDPSPGSIEVARRRYSRRNVEFSDETVESYAARSIAGAFSLAIANMSLMTTLDLDAALRAIARLLRPAGHLVITVPHPAFWPLHRRYAYEEWFEYTHELPVEGEFVISLSSDSGVTTTHVHRPLSTYVNCLVDCGFCVDRMLEPLPPSEAAGRFPEQWRFPRFLAVRATRQAND